MPNDNSSYSWLDLFSDGGLPQILLGPAGKALSRLVGASVEYPATYIEGFSQRNKDKFDARSKISQAMADKAAELAVSDPEIMDRAMDSFLGRQYRGQRNKEAIAKITIENLQSDLPSSDENGPSEDWINKFERYAEDASSDDLRLIYSKLLEGEVRNAGSVSPATLHFVSLLDGEVSKLIDRVLPYTIDDGITYIDAMSPGLPYSDKTILEQSGFWTMNRTYNMVLENSVQMQLLRENVAAIIEGPEKHRLSLEVAMLSKAGRDLAKIINREFDHKAFADLILRNGATKCSIGVPIKVGDGKYRLDKAGE
ncbi:hypothetical protein DSM110093_00216 [Sulfitobacter sp. DSM 110093]|uniref:DUF2806 domain-containing protein n=1 Tax=Sulfitobacter sp. DSM 110093 TaxID=2883127 RepID=UPI001FAC7A6F|nr:DUF2806 domain-containing protein [Sulfitobacter sp. DSM 110093]UOA30468.1 hypothetical protein DSM110093_00216 [Sulfitobacter sp. DSM 110093]